MGSGVPTLLDRKIPDFAILRLFESSMAMVSTSFATALDR